MPSVATAISPAWTPHRPSSENIFRLISVGRTASLLVLVGIITLAGLKGPVAGLMVLAGVLTVIGMARFPEYALVFGGLATLGGGTFSTIAQGGGLVLVAGGCLSGIALLARRSTAPWRQMILPVLILAWLGLRFAVEGDFAVVADVARCAAALVLVLDCLERRRNVVRALALGGAAFVVVSATIGIYSPTGLRFEGISGNPNRMSFGLLLVLPFLFSLLLSRVKLITNLWCAAAITGALFLILRSGSLQGFAGLVVMAIALACCWARRWSPAKRIAAVCAGLAALVLLAGPATEAVRGSPDLETLSGRTPIYVAALHEILQSPFVGSGQQHFFTGGTFDRSAHSVVLAMAVAGGIWLGVAWVAVLVILVAVAVRMVRSGNVLAAAPIVLIAEQFVQTVHLLPLTWALIGVLLAIREPGDLYGGPRPDRRAIDDRRVNSGGLAERQFR